MPASISADNNPEPCRNPGESEYSTGTTPFSSRLEADRICGALIREVTGNRGGVANAEIRLPMRQFPAFLFLASCATHFHRLRTDEIRRFHPL